MYNYTYFTPPMPNPPESTFLLRLCIFSLPEFWMTVIHPRIQMFTFMKESVSFHHPIIWTSLKNITPMFLSIEILVHFVFNALIEYREQKYPKNNGINYFMQWLKWWNIRKSQFIIPSKSRSSMMETCTILQFILMML